MKNKVLACLFLFVFVVLSQKVLSIVAPREGNFKKHVIAASLYSESKLSPERVTDFSPFYFDLNLILFRWIGVYDGLLVWLQIMAAAISVVLFYLTSAKYFSNWTAVIAALALSLSSSFLILTQVFVPDVWFLTFLLACAWSLTRNQSTVFHLLSGVFLGLALYTRPTALLYVPFAISAIYFSDSKNFLKATGKFLVVLLIFVAAVQYRNHHYSGKFSLIVMDPGGVFFEGNNPASDGNGVSTRLIKDLEGQYLGQPSYAQALLKRIPSVVSGKEMDMEQSNQYWHRKALHYIHDYPGTYARLLLRKVHRLFQTQEVHDVLPALEVSTAIKDKHFPVVPASFTAALAFTGIILARKDWKKFSLFYGGFLIGCMVPLIYFVSSRYRLPLMPFLLFFSCVSAELIAAETIRHRFGRPLILIAFCVVFALLLDLPAETTNTPNEVWTSIKRAHHFQRIAADLRAAGKREAAAENVSNAIQSAPFLYDGLILANLPYNDEVPLKRAVRMKYEQCQATSGTGCYFDFALLLLHSNNIPEARKIFQVLSESGESFRRWYTCSPDPEYYLGWIAGNHDQDWIEAIRHYRNVLDQSPGDPDTLAGLIVALEKTHDTGDAGNYRSQLFRYFDEADAMFFLGESYLNAGEFGKSETAFSQVVKWLPDYRKARIYFAVSLGKQGKIKESVQEYRKAVAIKEEPLLFQNAILDIFRTNLEENRNAENYFAYGVILRQNGKFEEAQQMQLHSLQLQPAFQPAAIELKNLAMVLTAKQE